MIKRILVPLDSTPFTGKAIQMACRIAKLHDAEVRGLVVLNIPGIEKSIGPVPMGASHYAKVLEHKKIDIAEKVISDSIEIFRYYCEKEGVKHSEHHRQGLPANKILEESKFYDLVCIGMQTNFNLEDDDYDTFDKILDNSVTPILAVPKDYEIPKAGVKPKVLICFDGDFPSCQALHRFARLGWGLKESLEVKMLMSTDNKKYAEHYFKDAKLYLQSHGFDNISAEYTAEDIIKKVRTDYLDWPDMYVIGAHTDKGIFDFMAGSLMKFLITDSKKPIFLGQ